VELPTHVIAGIADIVRDRQKTKRAFSANGSEVIQVPLNQR